MPAHATAINPALQATTPSRVLAAVPLDRPAGPLTVGGFPETDIVYSSAKTRSWTFRPPAGEWGSEQERQASLDLLHHLVMGGLE